MNAKAKRNLLATCTDARIQIELLDVAVSCIERIRPMTAEHSRLIAALQRDQQRALKRYDLAAERLGAGYPN